MEPAAELVVLGPVYTGDPSDRWSDAVAVRDGRVIGLGAERAEALTGPRTRVIEAEMVTPGFQDAHVHVPFAGRNRANVELNDLPGKAAYLERIARFAAADPDREWIVGGGWAMEHFERGTPLKEDLDRIVGDRPVFLYNRDVHGAWVNSVALARAGIDAETPDPPDGRIERDPVTGEPAGTLHEGAAYTFEQRFVPRPDRGEWEAAIDVGQAHLHSLGITGWQDAWVTPGTLAAYRVMATDGRLTGRVVGALWWDRHRGIEQIDDFRQQREQQLAPFFPTSVKIMIDGVLENQTGALLEPYCDGCGDHNNGDTGLTYVDPELLAEAVTRLDALDFQVHMHAIGDRAVRLGLDAVEAARMANVHPGRTNPRHHIAHLQIVQPEDIPRFHTLDVVANLQAFWAQSEPQMEELTIPFIGRDRAERQYPFGDLVRSGARLAMGSDWGVTTADPLAQLEVAVTRVDPKHRETPPFLPEQRLPLSVALDAFTAGSAYVDNDTEGGRLQVGARADLAVLDRNIFTAGVLPADARVTHTVANGKVVYES
ncbi:MAG: Amidohydrolase 3 [Pseudonocardiales bacterium]|nr:Amidohydrolase 3 [Pseudonocardiales bacterium]